MRASIGTWEDRPVGGDGKHEDKQKAELCIDNRVVSLLPDECEAQKGSAEAC